MTKLSAARRIGQSSSSAAAMIIVVNVKILILNRMSCKIRTLIRCFTEVMYSNCKLTCT